MTENITPDGYKITYFGNLLFGDRFRFVGDLEGTSYGPVTCTQNYGDDWFSVDTLGGGQFHGNPFRKVALIHRAPACTDCGRHVDFCDGCESPWPAELEQLWTDLYGGR